MESTLESKAKTIDARSSVASLTRRNALALQNRRLVFFVLNRYFSRLTGADRDDAESAGYLGLVVAAEGWNPALGTFSTYAVRAIWGAIGKQRRQARAQGFAGVSKAGVPAGTCLSLETPIGDDSTGGTVADRVADESELADVEETVTGAVEQAGQMALLWRAVRESLVPRQADILRLLYWEGLTAEEVADRRGEPLRAIQTGHMNALKSLRVCMARRAEREARQATAARARAKASQAAAAAVASDSHSGRQWHHRVGEFAAGA